MKFCFGVNLVFFFLLNVSWAQEALVNKAPSDLSVDQVIAEFCKRQATASEVAFVRMVTVTPAGFEEAREFFSIFYMSPEETKHLLVRMINPEAVKGVSLLSVQKKGSTPEQFMYMTDLDRVSKVRDSGRSMYFLASDFTYEDLLNEIPEDFVYKQLADEKVQGKVCYKIRATPSEKNVTSGYVCRDLFISQDGRYNLIKIDFYQANDKKIKTMEAYGYKAITKGMEAMRPRRTVMTNHEKKTRTILTIEGNGVPFTFDPKWVTPEAIGKWPKDQDQKLIELLKKAR